MKSKLTIADVDPYGFYSLTDSAEILDTTRQTLHARKGEYVRDILNRIPGWQLLQMAGVDWRVERAKQPRGDVRKRIRELV